HAVKSTLRKLGFSGLSDEQFESIFDAFINLADKKKEVYSHDLYMIVKNYFKEQDLENADIDRHAKDFIEMMELQLIRNTMFPTASVQVKKDNKVIKNSANDNGPKDA